MLMSCVNNVSKMDIMLRTEQKICMQKMLTIMMKSKIMTAALNTFFIRLDAVNCEKIGFYWTSKVLWIKVSTENLEQTYTLPCC